MRAIGRCGTGLHPPNPALGDDGRHRMGGSICGVRASAWNSGVAIDGIALVWSVRCVAACGQNGACLARQGRSREWASAACWLPGLLLLPLTAVLPGSTGGEDKWPVLLCLLMVVSSVFAASVSLGVAMWAWCRRGTWAVVGTFAIWGLANAGSMMMLERGLFDPGADASSSSHPVAAVLVLSRWIGGFQPSDRDVLNQIMAGAMFFAAAAGVLFLAAIVGRKSEAWHEASGELKSVSVLARPRAGKLLRESTNN